MRVRGIKNKDINPVCLSLALSREVRLRFARLPLRPLCLSRDMLCLFAEAGPSKAASAQCVQLHRFTNTFLVGRQAYMAPAYHLRLKVIKLHFSLASWLQKSNMMVPFKVEIF